MDKAERGAMIPIVTPYLQIDSVGARLSLYGAGIQRSIRLDSYDVRVEDSWFRLSASEIRGSTGVGPPSRSVALQGFGLTAEQLLRLERHLLANGGPLQMRDALGETFEVTYKKVASSLFFSGVFLTEGDDDEFQCRIRIPEDNVLIGIASEGKWESKRVLFVSDLTLEAQIVLIRTVTGGTSILIERTPWIT